jgi:hypothetical protein
MATAGTIGVFANEVNTQLKANRDLITQGAMTETIVKNGIDASTDIDTIIARLNAAIAALGGTRQISCDWIEDLTGLPFFRIKSLQPNGQISDQFIGLNGSVGAPVGPPQPLQPGRLAMRASNWGSGISDAELWRRLARLQFPGGVVTAEVTATLAGLTAVTNISVPTSQRIAITELIIQAESGTPNKVILKSTGTTTSNLRRYRLAGDGAGVDNIYQFGALLKGAPGCNVSIDLLTAAPVFCQIQYFLEDTVTGLSVTQ